MHRYQTLAISSGAESSTNANSELRKKGADEDGSLSLSQSSSKRVAPEWIFNLGESALAIQVTARTRNSTQIILVLGKIMIRSNSNDCSIQTISFSKVNETYFVYMKMDN